MGIAAGALGQLEIGHLQQQNEHRQVQPGTLGVRTEDDAAADTSLTTLDAAHDTAGATA